MSAPEFAACAGLETAEIQAVEAGRSRLGTVAMQAVCARFGLSPSYFFAE